MKFAKFASHFFRSSLQRFFWLFSHAKNRNDNLITVHMLVVNRKIYSKLAYLCILSFLFHHPNSRIVIHHDEKTFSSLQIRFFLLNKLKQRRVKFKQLQESNEWQLHKLNIILSLMGSTDFYMDCDLKWNGFIPPPETRGIIYFIKEKSFVEYVGLPEILNEIPIAASNLTMRNTSLFSWGGLSLNDSQVLQFRALAGGLQLSSQNLIYRSPADYHRIHEQISLSLIPELYLLPFQYLKESDQQFDGSVCESSYYGASGGRFALWGNTNRISIFKKKKAS